MAQEKEYFAFISYQRKDEEWADWLRSKLEHYRLPSSVRKENASLPKEIRPIFRDALELAGGVLAKEIETALQNSKFLIVICSPNSAKSPWVNKEIQTFIDLGCEDHIIPFIIDGTPFSDNEETECFPPALRSLKGEKELLGININELGRDAASIKVVARMFGLKFDTLWQRYEREQKRKRWMIVGSALLFAVAAIVIASIFFNLNNELKSTINDRDEALYLADSALTQVRKDSVVLAEHLDRIMRDSLTLAKQKGSIFKQNQQILSQRNSLNFSNKLLVKERNNVLKTNANLNISLVKTYLSQGRPEMALIKKYEIERNLVFLDSAKLSDYKLLIQSVSDSILYNSALLINIRNTTKEKTVSDKTLSHSKVVEFHYPKEGSPLVYIHNQKNKETDTIIGDPIVSWIVNGEQTCIAIYKDGEFEEEEIDNYNMDKLDIVYAPEKPGIRLYSLETGDVVNFVSCWGWFYWMTFPMGLSNDKRYLIYREGWQDFERIWFIDFKEKRRTPMQTWYSNNDSGYAFSSFCPNDNYFFISNEKEIDIYSTQSKKKIHTFRYEECDSVYWDDSNNICISSNGKVFTWKIVDKVNNIIFQTGSRVNGVTLSNDNKYAAAACNDGIVYIWDILTKRLLFAQELLSPPEDVAFTNDNKKLWVTSKHEGIKIIDIENKTIKSIHYENDAPNAFNRPFLYMTKDGRYGVCLNYDYAIFDMKGFLIEQGRLSDKTNEDTKRILSECILPGVTYETPLLMDSQKSELTAIRDLNRGMCIEGYSDGTIKVYSNSDRALIESIIIENNVSLKNEKPKMTFYKDEWFIY